MIFLKEHMNILFVCSANKHRSRTAEDLFQAKYPKFQVLSAGTNRKVCLQEGTTPLEDDLVAWADIIFVMEQKHKDIILENTQLEKVSHKIQVLNIQDIYKYNQPELIEEIERKTCAFQARVKDDKYPHSNLDKIINEKLDTENNQRLLIYEQDYDVVSFGHIVLKKNLEAYIHAWTNNYISRSKSIKWEYVSHDITKYGDVNVKLKFERNGEIIQEYIGFHIVELDKTVIWEPGEDINNFDLNSTKKALTQSELTSIIDEEIKKALERREEK